jgi:hypothetical protein
VFRSTKLPPWENAVGREINREIIDNFPLLRENKDFINKFVRDMTTPQETAQYQWYQGAKGYLLSKLRCKILAPAMPGNASPG